MGITVGGDEPGAVSVDVDEELRCYDRTQSKDVRVGGWKVVAHGYMLVEV